MISNSILPIPLSDGVYYGTWNGFYVTISTKGEVARFKVDKALRNYNFPCIVVVENKKAVIDSGNPLIKPTIGWVNEKPKFNEDCVLITADNINGLWEYRSWIIKWTNNGDGPYLGWFNGNGDEYGDLSDLKADRYFILSEPV